MYFLQYCHVVSCAPDLVALNYTLFSAIKQQSVWCVTHSSQVVRTCTLKHSREIQWFYGRGLAQGCSSMFVFSIASIIQERLHLLRVSASAHCFSQLCQGCKALPRLESLQQVIIFFGSR